MLGDPRARLAAGAPVTVSIRPECWKLGLEAPAGNAVRGRIGDSVYLGELAQYDFVASGMSLKIFELNPRFLGRRAAGRRAVCERGAGRRGHPHRVKVGMGHFARPVRAMRGYIIILLLAAIVALPFLLRPERVAQRNTRTRRFVIVSPHNEAIRHEFALGFQQWYRARTGKTAVIDWRVLGGTSEIARYLEGEYVAAFQNYWRGRLGRPWSAEMQAGFQDGRLPPNAPPLFREASASFLRSDIGCGIDLFFGGGAYDFDQQALAGRIVASDLVERHPDWFTDAAMPRTFRRPAVLGFSGALVRQRDQFVRHYLQPRCASPATHRTGAYAMGGLGRPATPRRGGALRSDQERLDRHGV